MTTDPDNELFYGPDDDDGEDYGDPFYEPDPDAQLEEYYWRLSCA
jgi:hypothetical protein